MDRKTSEQVTLSPEEAKSRLREVAARFGIEPWVRRQPFGAMIFGVAAGFAIGRLPRLWYGLSHPQVRRMLGRLGR